MYPECRHVKTNGAKCHAPALGRSYWCYFHNQIHRRQGRQQERGGRPPRLTRAPHPGLQPSHPVAGAGWETTAARTLPASTATLDHGHIPVFACPADPGEAGSLQLPAVLQLPVLEDQAAIQFALNDILQALAANQLDPKRAGLLLYGLQIASHNSRDLAAHHDPVRAVTYAADGSVLGPAIEGWDIEDMPDESEHEDEDEDEV